MWRYVIKKRDFAGRKIQVGMEMLRKSWTESQLDKSSVICTEREEVETHTVKGVLDYITV